ncbi:flavin reductase family protein [uncultured Cloacibacillus sp.]|uniref:flavin reductase family protein n=1 Tax=uncultured Cloacibacillus sp. TaxID=889794 RepID=UPI00262140C7|nr:flavin reductase family protein [uncultured Cloacibacillus sp.]
MLYPLPPVMVSCGTLERSNIITAAWTGTVNSEPPMTYVSVRPERHSYAMIKESGEFVINLTTERLARAADLCGVKSGREVQKFRLCRLTPIPASSVAAPLIAESPVNIECRVEQRLALGSHDMFLAKVVAVNVDEALLDAKGVLHLERAGLAAYVHGRYRALGRELGKFGFSVQKKQEAKR